MKIEKIYMKIKFKNIKMKIKFKILLINNKNKYENIFFYVNKI